MKIGIFGCGNMGEALSIGFRSKDSSLTLFLYNPTKEKAEKLALKVNGLVVINKEDMPQDCDWYILAFKPQSLGDFHFNFKEGANVLSLLAGVGISTLEKKFTNTHLARLMPNTPSRLSLGANLFYAQFLDQAFLDLLNSLGKTYVMNSEDQLDILTGVSGSGPALIFEFALAFYENSLKSGLDSKTATDLVCQTFLGTVKLMEEAKKAETSFEELRDQVVSKKGVTHEALVTLRNNQFGEILNSAFQNAYKRTLEIKKEIDHA